MTCIFCHREEKQSKPNGSVRSFEDVKVTQTSRVYLLPDVLDWLYRNRRNKVEAI
jgi:hypothetical protein